MDMIKMGRFISQCRKELGYTQEALGERLGVTDKAVSKWERGLSCPDILLLNRLSAELKVSLVELLECERREKIKNSNSVFTSSTDEITHSSLLAPTLTIDGYEDGNYYVSPLLFGNNLEHTRLAINGGISAQMLRNRKFVGFQSVPHGVAEEWFRIGERTYCCFSQKKAYTRHIKEHYHMSRRFERNSQSVRCFENGELAGIGQHEISIKAGVRYDFAAVVRASDALELHVALTSRGGGQIYGESVISVEKNEGWVRYTASFSANGTDADGDLRLTFTSKACIVFGAISLMPSDNFRGMRKDVIAAMKQIGVSVLRWPGGNFAGEYSWFDGLLPVDERSPLESYLGIMTQPNTLGYDFHEINTDDFIALCREIGAEPCIVVNLTWNTPEENAAWVEYCNGGPDTEYGRLRIERGYEEPYNVKLWGIGNEFGYGHMEGDNTPYGYSRLAQDNAKAMLAVTGDLILSSCGPYPNTDWSKYSAKALKGLVPLVSMHYYCDPEPHYFDESKFEDEYYRSILSVNTIRKNLYQLKEESGGDIKISFDEWNVWHAWYRASCVADGIFAALVLHMIFKEAQSCGIEIACHFAIPNGGTIDVQPYKVTVTASGQMMELMKRHSLGKLIYSSDCVVATKKEGIITQTAINVSYDKSKRIVFPKSEICESILYRGNTIFPHSRFEECELTVTERDGTCEIEIPPHSVACVCFKAE